MPEVIDSIDADLELLNDESEDVSEVIEEPTTEEVVEKHEDVKEEKEEESKKEEVKEEEPPKVDTLYERPSFDAIKAKYPDLFKDFPSLRDMYFREQEFNKVFTSVEEAKEASENDQAFRTLRNTVYSGDSKPLLNAIKETDPAAFKSYASNLLPALQEISPEAHWHAVVPTLEAVIHNMVAEGKRSGDENMQNAAAYVSKFLFNTPDVAEGKASFIEKKTVDPQLAAEREKFENERFSSFDVDVRTEIFSSLKNLIEDNLDPDGVMTPFIRNTIISETMAQVGKQLMADRSHLSYMDRLWEKAKAEGLTSDSKAKIKSAYLARVKQLVPGVRAKLVSEAIGTSAKVSEKNKAKIESIESRKDKTGSVKASNGVGKMTLDPKKIDWRNTSDLDILNSDD
jgi:hypothetical protein